MVSRAEAGLLGDAEEAVDVMFPGRGDAEDELDGRCLPGYTLPEGCGELESLADVTIELGQEVAIQRVHVWQSRVFLLSLEVHLEPLSQETVAPLLARRPALEAPASGPLADVGAVIGHEGRDLGLGCLPRPFRYGPNI